jgi:hypothetical protein
MENLMDEQIKARVEVDVKAATIKIPHWGITQRSLHGAALDAWMGAQPGESKDFTVIYKGKPIAVIFVQKHATVEN